MISKYDPWIFGFGGATLSSLAYLLNAPRSVLLSCALIGWGLCGCFVAFAILFRNMAEKAQGERREG